MRYPFVITVSLLFAATAAAQSPYPNPDRCMPISIGDRFNKVVSGVLSAGENNENYQMPVAGAQIHIDSRDVRSGGLPEGAFIKAPDSWPLEYTDEFNRRPIPPAMSPLLGDDMLGITYRINHLAAASFELNFNCNPDAFGGKLKDGALKLQVEFAPSKDEADDELQVQLVVQTFAGKIALDLVDVDLDETFKVHVAAVPTVNPNGNDVDLDFYYDFNELFKHAIIGELVDEIVTVAASASLLMGQTAALTFCVGDPVCVAATSTATGIIVTAGVLAYEQEMRQASADMMASALDEFTQPYRRNNGMLKKVREEFRSQVLAHKVYEGMNLLEAVDALPVPEFDIEKFEPVDIPATCKEAP